MFALITQKFQLRRAVLLVVALAAVSASGCTSSELPSTIETTQTLEGKLEQIDYCPNLPDVFHKDELPETYVQDYSVTENAFKCIPVEEMRERLAEMDRLHQETVAKATALVLGPQPPSEATAYDKITKAIAYYCNHIGDKEAEFAARLVYSTNYVPAIPMPPSTTQPEGYTVESFDGRFDKLADLVCGYQQTEEYVEPIAPVEPPTLPTVES